MARLPQTRDDGVGQRPIAVWADSHPSMLI
jgi:hypothetical protein